MPTAGDHDLILVIRNLQLELPNADEEQGRRLLLQLERELAKLEIPAHLAARTLAGLGELELSLPGDSGEDAIVRALVQAVQGSLLGR